MHVFSAGCSEVERMLRFRDHLRTDRADRELYERTKRELAGRTWHYVQHYANAKSDVVGAIMTRAHAAGERHPGTTATATAPSTDPRDS
jgi:GrpB-like predicted nucleotidyltransferase (UPF0157 family)